MRPQAFGSRLRIAVKAPRDPGYGALRRAIRATIVIPLAFVFADLVLREPQIVIFVMFGCFSLLVISDFGGMRRPRAIAYLAATVVGAALVGLGTLVSSSAWLAAGVMFLVGFAISFSRIFGGYVAAANIGMLLAFVIAVTIPAPADTIPARIGGWAFAGLVSTAAAVALWPRFERLVAHKQAAKALLAIAELVEGMQSGKRDRDLPRLEQAARQEVDAARHGYAATAKRPLGPARRPRAYAQLLIQLERVIGIIERPFTEHRMATRPGLAEGDRLIASVAAELRSSADVLTGGTAPNPRVIEDAREEHRVARDRWAAEQLRAGRPAEQGLDGLDYDGTPRVVSSLSRLLSGFRDRRQRHRRRRRKIRGRRHGSACPADHSNPPRIAVDGVAGQPPRGHRSDACGLGRPHGRFFARLLGRVGNDPGPAQQRPGHGPNSSPGRRGQRDRRRHRRGFPAWRRGTTGR